MSSQSKLKQVFVLWKVCIFSLWHGSVDKIRKPEDLLLSLNPGFCMGQGENWYSIHTCCHVHCTILTQINKCNFNEGSQLLDVYQGYAKNVIITFISQGLCSTINQVKFSVCNTCVVTFETQHLMTSTSSYKYIQFLKMSINPSCINQHVCSETLVFYTWGKFYFCHT